MTHEQEVAHLTEVLAERKSDLEWYQSITDDAFWSSNMAPHYLSRQEAIQETQVIIDECEEGLAELERKTNTLPIYQWPTPEQVAAIVKSKRTWYVIVSDVEGQAVTYTVNPSERPDTIRTRFYDDHDKAWRTFYNRATSRNLNLIMDGSRRNGYRVQVSGYED